MAKPTAPIVIYSIIFVIGMYKALNEHEKNYIHVFLLIFFYSIYIYGVVYFYDLVRNASTHGNTIHGWNSIYNKFEKKIASYWIYSFPIVGFALLILILFVISRILSSNEKSK